jgi:hypothetical protein
MKSPNGKYEVLKHDFNEIRMGSPWFGHISVLGSNLRTNVRIFGEAMAFSPDSRFLAVEELVADHPAPHTKALVFEVAEMRQHFVHEQKPGFIKRFVWSEQNELTITTWRHTEGDKQVKWKTPS